LQALEEVKLREMAIIELQKKIGDSETKLKQQQNLYEAVRVDRNMYSKNLIESQDEIHEMKRKFKIMNHQIEQLKDEISNKDLALVKEHFDHLKVRRGRGQGSWGRVRSGFRGDSAVTVLQLLTHPPGLRWRRRRRRCVRSSTRPSSR